MKHLVRWRLVLTALVAVMMLLGTATPALAAVTDIFFGIRDNGWIDTYDPVTGTTVPIIDVVPPVADTSSSGPNGLAYDETTNRLYFTEYPDAATSGHPLDGKADLWFVDLNSAVPTATFAGKLPGQIANADIYNGEYYYINSIPATDDFYRVPLNPDGTITDGVWTKTDIAANAHGWTFDGDIAIWEGVVYGWGCCRVHSGGTYEFFKVNCDGTGFAVMDSTLSAPYIGSAALQLAFASDGTLYGHNYGTGRTYRVSWDAANNVTATHLGVSTFRYTDTASGSTGSELGYSLTGTKWYDRDKDGVRDAGEPGIEGWKVFLFEGEPNPMDPTLIDWASVDDTLTAADGSYSFDELDSGLYKVVEGSASGCWKQTFPAAPGWYEKEIVDAGFEGLDFGNVCEKTSTGGFTLGYWSNKQGSATLNAYSTDPASEYDTWQIFLGQYNLVEKDGDPYDPGTYSAFRSWLLKADAENMSYMLSVQMAATLLNIEVQDTDYTGYGVLWNGEWKSIATLISEANAFLLAHPETWQNDAYRPEAEAYKNLFDDLNNNRRTLIPYDPCPPPVW